MILHSQLSPKNLRSKIHSRDIRFGGNKKLKIYGLLGCGSGKRMKMENRIFFKDEKEALQNNYRPCGHCMREAYKQWKQKISKQNPSHS
ncbi:Ada metal-binding domain-containing protein [Chryseobacterium sp.]|jgi:methylphosphotriester-DNA--protein-cysteine methyltransferase|uniref:Ada metal-binding domain-containing protein n=1 Tax=Chryseobacterium sp. TaxID=1871047 RepID=UPI00283AEBB6|nr:Ada metal-binding domain-containing protein [Chryseobacterium sp.]MDR3022973.1 metal-binding protein [Chryseobacterium sp.]